jgi:hypothetical protein
VAVVRSSAGMPPLALDAFDLAPGEAQRRFREAAGSGNPTWLWPHVAVEKWAWGLDRIVAVTREVMKQGASNQVLDGDAAAIGLAGYTSGMGPLLGHWLETGQARASPEVAAVLDLHLRHNRMRMERMEARLFDISHALAAGNIPHTVLKGMHTAYAYFPEPGARPLADIDLLVAPEHVSRASEVLSARGFESGVARPYPAQRTWRTSDSRAEPRSLCFVHADDPWSIDLHSSLDRRYAAGAPIIRLDEASRQGATEPSPLSSAAHVLGQPMLLLQLAVHASCGLESLNLLRLVELALVARADVAAERLSWEAFGDAAQQAGGLGHVYPALTLCEQLVPGTIPGEVLERARRETPPSVRRVIGPLTPATAHRVLRCSLAERFMWAPSRRAIARQVLQEAFPPGSGSPLALARIYRARLWRLARRTLTN